VRTPGTSSRKPSSKMAQASTRSTSYTVPTPNCVVCGDNISTVWGYWITAPCAHLYCPECAIKLVETYARDESLHPIRCCNKPIPKKDIDNFLSNADDISGYFIFQAKYEEYSTPAKERIYCPSRDCNKFISRYLIHENGPNFVCPHCYSEVCMRCKRLAHPGESCDAEDQTILFQQLIKKKKWQPCTRCGRTIERDAGCLHITCRCGHQFCYVCGGDYRGPDRPCHC
jgi:hypothetical protein